MTTSHFRVLALFGLALVVVVGCNAAKEPDAQPKPVEPESAPTPKPPAEIVEDGATTFFCGTAVADFQGVSPGETVLLCGECKGLEKGVVSFQLSKRYHGYRPALSAPTLAADYTKDEQSAKQKYDGRMFVVRGVFLGAKDMTVRISRVRAPGEVARGTDPRIALIQGVLGRPVEVAMTAEAVEAEQKKPEATDKYIRKIVEVTGRVLDFTPGKFGVDAVYIGTGKATTKIECIMIPRESWNELAYGQEVRIRGHCLGVGDTFYLDACVIAGRGPDPAKVTTATELAKEYAADPAKANDMYDPKTKDDKGKGATLLVSGEVVAWTDKSNRFFFQPLVLKGADGVRVVCTLGEWQYPEFEVPIGTKVQVMGRYRRSDEKDVVIISGCFLRYTR